MSQALRQSTRLPWGNAESGDPKWRWGIAVDGMGSVDANGGAASSDDPTTPSAFDTPFRPVHLLRRVRDEAQCLRLGAGLLHHLGGTKSKMLAGGYRAGQQKAAPRDWGNWLCRLPDHHRGLRHHPKRRNPHAFMTKLHIWAGSARAYWTFLGGSSGRRATLAIAVGKRSRAYVTVPIVLPSTTQRPPAPSTRTHNGGTQDSVRDQAQRLGLGACLLHLPGAHEY